MVLILKKWINYLGKNLSLTSIFTIRLTKEFPKTAEYDNKKEKYEEEDPKSSEKGKKKKPLLKEINKTQIFIKQT